MVTAHDSLGDDPMAAKEIDYSPPPALRDVMDSTTLTCNFICVDRRLTAVSGNGAVLGFLLWTL